MESSPAIILASTSPRRIELLKQLGIDFEAVSPNYAEDMTRDVLPEDLARLLALGKAESIASLYSNALIIGAVGLPLFPLAKILNDFGIRMF